MEHTLLHGWHNSLNSDNSGSVREWPRCCTLWLRASVQSTLSRTGPYVNFANSTRGNVRRCGRERCPRVAVPRNAWRSSLVGWVGFRRRWADDIRAWHWGRILVGPTLTPSNDTARQSGFGSLIRSLRPSACRTSRSCPASFTHCRVTATCATPGARRPSHSEGPLPRPLW